MHFLKKSAAAVAVALFPTTGLADFSGGYAGAGFSSITGDITAPDVIEDINLAIKEDTILTGFGGYQIQRGALVYGGELAISQANDGGIAGIGIEGLDTTAIDLKGRVGYVLDDRIMAYGTAGFSRFSTDIEPLGADETLESDGFIVGAGIDYLATDNIILGAEFTNRQVAGTVDAGGDLDIDFDVNSFTVRAAFKF